MWPPGSRSDCRVPVRSREPATVKTFSLSIDNDREPATIAENSLQSFAGRGIMKGWGSVSAAMFLCAGIAGASLVDARAVSVLCPPCIMPTTSEESDAFNSLMWDLQACNDSSCLAIGNAMGSISFSYVADDWSCIWHSNGCSGENFGDGTAWISRSGGDSTGQNALDGAIRGCGIGERHARTRLSLLTRRAIQLSTPPTILS